MSLHHAKLLNSKKVYAIYNRVKVTLETFILLVFFVRLCVWHKFV